MSSQCVRAETDPSSPPQSVLVVEDNDLLRYWMTKLLVQNGYMVLTAATARDALAMLRQPFATIGLVILDVCLPGASGIDLCARLRDLSPHLPVIVCTGEATPEDGGRLLHLGIRRYFLKPVASDELLASVAAVLG